MPEKYFEIRWHGRAGQGAKSASQFLTEAAVEAGKYSTAFPEYGAERSGAPMKAFNRIADVPIRIRSGIENPDVVVVFDDTMLGLPDITAGLGEDKIMLVNTVMSPEEVREKTGFKGKIYTIPATDIALEEIKRGIPNTVMIGALVKLTNVVPMEVVKEKVRKTFEKKFSEEVVQANLRAVDRGYQEVKGDA
ncbi:pyruvate synthase [Marinitoga sp. 1135]|uniref:2-oxoacid:acceptor oxidoreductase, gamma subunit, pyruvate/2-ketoisovalerate family n=1 Tax=Marinitoga piezophila (strain DSM 14283 / JCM 11233 / KA3) TaxID=443254 RepID=H2J4L2_MARPK|nr:MULTISPECIES: 2-oxoacid:acceptor oxidoreductase family protein [Marinitoga]AEX85954.1 2-oxoacid:acceptor oxidoreductase, gamma subunit, pyruvate/2-ketoisovalerate family [Marinitoga piezophila KA3]APT76381.1 pyruvate synthase [Marinitoga sp. 1137]NUU96151.1 pyruvate synthase [Marinitoga sp. 1135]NUU98059.1 pyruvate synthase [Marinitoga sp. 1138]